MTREHSAIIKGIGILLMMIWHLFYVVGPHILDSKFYLMLQNASHMIYYCLIISGYGLYLVYHNNRLTWSYLIKRSVRLYLALWLVFLIFVMGLGTILYPGRFSHSWYFTITNFTAWRWDYCNFTWFLLPYVLMTFCSKFVFKMIDRVGDIISFIIGTVLYLVATWLISQYYESYFRHNYAVYHLVLLAQTLFGLIIGAIMARMTLQGKSMKLKCLEGRSWLVFLLFVVGYALRTQIHFAGLNPFFAIFVIFIVVNIDWPAIPSKILSSLGNKLMMMWFVQGFVGAFMFQEYYQPLQWPALIWLVWVIVTYLVACLLTPVSNWLAKALKLA